MFDFNETCLILSRNFYKLIRKEKYVTVVGLKELL